MQLNRQRVKEIASLEFAQASDADIQTWLRGALVGWSTDKSVLAFAPFQNFFPSTHDEVERLSQILLALPNEKTAGLPYSLQDQFRRALTNLIGKKEIYLSDPEILELTFDLAKEMELTESVSAIKSLLSDKRFRQKMDSSGLPLIDASLRLSFMFGPTKDVISFWRSCIPHISEAPYLSTQLLSRLVEAFPPNWANFALDAKMRAAIIQYQKSQHLLNPASCEKWFDRLASKLSSIISDEDYLAGVQKLKYRDLDFLVDIKRVRALIRHAGESPKREIKFQAHKSRQAVPKPINLRGKIGRRNIEAHPITHYKPPAEVPL